MMKHFVMAGVLGITLLASGCGTTASSQENTVKEVVVSQKDTQEQAKSVPIRLTVNGRELKARLYDTSPARSLRQQLPKTVELNDSDNDFCGDTLDIEYQERDVQSGYKNGDLAYWPPAKNFVIFVHGEEKSASTDNLVILGHIDEPQSVLDSLHGNLIVKMEEAGL